MKIVVKPDHLEKYKRYQIMIQATHRFLQSKDYLSLDLPVLSPALIPESYLEIFATQFTYFDNTESLFLTPSPELFMKRLLVYGIGNCYSLGKSFRNSEPGTPRHSPEFTMLEFYKVKADYMALAGDVLGLLQAIAMKLTHSLSITFHDKTVSLKHWEKITVAEAFQRYAQITPDQLFDEKQLRKAAQEKQYSTENASYDDIFSQIYVQEIEPHLGVNGYLTLLYDYPKQFAALAKINSDGKTAQRFEFYIGGVELGDAYTELTDWKEQEDRFMKEDKKRKELGKIAHPIDKGFIQALQYGLVDCAGIAIGMDRLGMVFTDSQSITDSKLLYIE